MSRKTKKIYTDEDLMKHEAQVRVNIYLDILANFEINPKHPRHANFIQKMKEIILAHGKVLPQ